jgi:hypothetical protein
MLWSIGFEKDRTMYCLASWTVAVIFLQLRRCPQSGQAL